MTRKVKLEDVYKIENIISAEKEARKGKQNNYGVKLFNKNYDQNIKKIQEEIMNLFYRTPMPKLEPRICDHGKVRVLAKIPYYFHVIHHALMRVILPILEKSYYYESSASIRGRGIHYSVKHIRKFINRHNKRPLWWSQIDLVKCYHNIDRNKLFNKLCKRFKDQGIREMLHDIIWALRDHNGLNQSDGNHGVGIGIYPVQSLMNFHLNDLDRTATRVKGVKIFRYCDNILIIGFSPKAVWKCINVIKSFIKDELDQPIHENIGVQKLDDVHPVDFVGYKFFLNKTRIRPRTKIKIFKTIKKLNKLKDEERKKRVLSSYKGWLIHCNGLKLWRTVTGMMNFEDLNKKLSLVEGNTTVIGEEKYFNVPVTRLSFLTNKQIIIKDFVDNCKTANGTGRMYVLFEDENGVEQKFCTNNILIKNILIRIKEANELPFSTTIKQRIISGNKIDYYFS